MFAEGIAPSMDMGCTDSDPTASCGGLRAPRNPRIGRQQHWGGEGEGLLVQGVDQRVHCNNTMLDVAIQSPDEGRSVA